MKEYIVQISDKEQNADALKLEDILAVLMSVYSEYKWHIADISDCGEDKANTDEKKKIYVYDMHWQGAVICIANNEEEAKQKMIAADQLNEEFMDHWKNCYKFSAYDLDTVALTKGDTE